MIMYTLQTKFATLSRDLNTLDLIHKKITISTIYAMNMILNLILCGGLKHQFQETATSRQFTGKQEIRLCKSVRSHWTKLCTETKTTQLKIKVNYID